MRSAWVGALSGSSEAASLHSGLVDFFAGVGASPSPPLPQRATDGAAGIASGERNIFPWLSEAGGRTEAAAAASEAAVGSAAPPICAAAPPCSSCFPERCCSAAVVDVAGEGDAVAVDAAVGENLFLEGGDEVWGWTARRPLSANQRPSSACNMVLPRQTEPCRRETRIGPEGAEAKDYRRKMGLFFYVRTQAV